MNFYLGSNDVRWLAHDDVRDVPMFYSIGSFRRDLPRAVGPWALDSGAYTELVKHGDWRLSACEYAKRVLEIRDRVGGMEFACTQDWVCAPNVLEQTGLTVREHQERTVGNYLMLRELAGDVPWMPTLQGWRGDDYARHVEMYARGGVDVAALPRIGIGTIASRQDDPMVGRVVRALAANGLCLHGFGVKKTGLRMYADALGSADSQAWTFDARFSNSPRVDGSARRGGPVLRECVDELRAGNHPSSCSDCKRFALWWRNDLIEKLGGRLTASTQDQLFVPDASYVAAHIEMNTRHGVPRQIIVGLGRASDAVSSAERLFETEETE